jgi:hypothetical protein
MFNPLKPEPTSLDVVIEAAFKDLQDVPADSDEFAAIVDQQTKLHALRPQRKQLDPNTLIIAAVNLYVGWRALKFEETGVITTGVHKFMQKFGQN